MIGQENLKKLALDTNEKRANDVAMETCTTTRDTASIDGRVKKDPVEDVGQEGLSEPLPRDPENSAKDKLARERLDSSSEMGSKLLDEFASICEKKFPEEPPEEENKNEGTRTDVLVLVLVLFLLLYNGAVMVRDFMEMKQQQRDLVRMWIKTKRLQLNAYNQIQDSSVYDVEESCTEESLRVEKADSGFEFVSKRVAVSNSSAREMVELREVS